MENDDYWKELVTVWGEWISPKFCTQEEIIRLRKWFLNEDATAISLQDFLILEKSEKINTCLSKLTNYVTSYSLMVKGGIDYTEVNEAEFNAKDVSERFGRHQIIKPISDVFLESNGLSQEEMSEIELFFKFLFAGSAFKSWISIITQSELSDKVTLEMVKYETGDYLSPHSDTHDDRLLGVNIYFDPNWTLASGGVLQFRSNTEELVSCYPLFNSISLIPIKKSYEHWVTPWESDEAGRFSFSMSFRPKD